MGIFSKSNSTEYNNRLEKILEEKKFDSETKSLLLSMLYKIETSYEDYNKVKVDSDSKEEFIEKLLYIIQEECEEIKAVTPKTEQSEELEKSKKTCIVDELKGKILVYANEKDLLYSIFLLDTKINHYINNQKYNFENIKEENMIMFKAIQEFIQKGEAMESSEIIRDFNRMVMGQQCKRYRRYSY